jgi:hypothetical protein
VTLPRKLYRDLEWRRKTLEAKVHPLCVDLWLRGRAAGRNDSFIGLINSNNLLFFLAPCFGVDSDVALVPKDSDDKHLPEAHLRPQKIARGEFDVGKRGSIIQATSARMKVQKWKKSTIEDVYGAGNVCYVPLKGEDFGTGNFDGWSHQALFRFLKNHAGFALQGNWWSEALGFAIQREPEVGYFIRYASRLNQLRGQLEGDPFSARTKEREKHPTVDPRDLPGQWSRLCETILVRDLKLSLSNNPGEFVRVKSHRNPAETSKASPFVPNRDAHLDAAFPGTEGTGHRLV